MGYTKKLFIFLILSIFMVSSVSAYFPISHKFMQNKAILEYSDKPSDFYKMCSLYPKKCYVGNVLTDLSVAWYYVKGGENYIITHDSAFAQANLRNAINDEQRACAIGSAIHASQDLSSHNGMVPYAIRATGLPNSVIHVFAEQHLDNIISKNYPNTLNEIGELTQEDWNVCIELFKKTLEESTSYQELKEGELDEVINIFVSNVAVVVDPNAETGYSLSFKNKTSLFGKIGFLPTYFLFIYFSFTFLFALLSVLLIFRKNKGILNWISLVFFGLLFLGLLIFILIAFFGDAFAAFVWAIKPISNLVPIGSAENWIDTSIRETHSLFINGESWLAQHVRPYDASGFAELKKADASAVYTGSIIGIVALSIFVLLIYLNFRKGKRKTENFNL